MMPRWRPGGGSVFCALTRAVPGPPISPSGMDGERLGLGFHDLRQLHETRLVEPQIGGDDRRQIHFERLESGIDLASDLGRGLGQLELRGERRLGAVPQGRQHLARLVVVVVDGLLAEDDEERLFAFHELEQYARDVQRLERRVGNHVQRALRAHGQRVAQCGLAIRGSDGGDDDFVGTPALLDAQGFFDGNGIEGIDAELDAVERDARAIGLHANANVVVDDAFDCDENPSGLRVFHRFECSEVRRGVRGMLTYTLRRIAGLVPTLFVLVTLSFFIIRLAPGGPFDQQQALPPEIRANLDAAYGFDQPLIVQYGRYLAGVVQGDLGPSLRYKDFTVTELIARGLPLSLTIGLAAALLAFFTGVPLGAYRGMARRFLGRSRHHGFFHAGRGVAGIRGRAAAGAGVRHLLADIPRRRLRAREC